MTLNRKCRFMKSPIKALFSLKQDLCQFTLINFANADMVGHTGSIGPAVKACEAIDICVGKIANFVLAFGGYLIITADHGNAEVMINPETGQIFTEHTTSPVPFIAVSQEFQGQAVTLSSGILADIAPTVLNLLGLEAPSVMTGKIYLGKLEDSRTKIKT